MKYLVAIVVILSGFTAVNAQTPLALNDSLLLKAAREKNPVAKIQLENAHVLYLHSKKSMDSAIKVVDEFLGKYQGNDLAMGRFLSTKAYLLTFKLRYVESLEMLKDALVYSERANDTLGRGLTINRIGLEYYELKRPEEAKKYFKEALRIFEMLKEGSKTEMVINNLGVIAQEQKQYDSAIIYHNKSLALRMAIKSYHWVAYSYYNIAECYVLSNQYDSAEKYFRLSEKTFIELSDGHKVAGLAQIGMARFDFKNKRYREALRRAKDAIKSAEQTGNTQLLLSSYEVLSEAYHALGNNDSAYAARLRHEEYKSTYDSANSAEKIAQIDARYIAAEKEGEISKLKAANLEVTNEAQHARLLILYVAIGALVVIGVVVFVFQRRRQKQRLFETELRRKISDVRLIALRAQMNPHFIFNCINTAQNFVLSAKKEEAYDYLAKFAQLLRAVLENSEKPFIALEDELKQITLYMELERTRFDGKFTYTIDVDPELENGVFEVPSMLLQPLVENAILHGLNHRNDSEGRLRISLKLNENSIECRVADNGVGRKRAAEIKAQKEKHFSSAAIPNIRERLGLMSSDARVSFETTDLYEGDVAVGTEVVLQIPFK